MKTLCILFLSFLWTITASATPNDTVPTCPMEEIIVQSGRLTNKLKNIPQRVEIISQEDIQSVPNENLAEVVKRLANLDVIQYPGVSATIGQRGFSPSAHSRSYTLLLINGKPAGTNNLASILASNIERIEVIKGPYAALFGSDAMGGVINIVTKSLPKELSGECFVEGGSFDFYRINGSVGKELFPHFKGGLSFSTMKQGQDYRIGKNNLLKTNALEKLILDKNAYGDTMKNACYDFSQVHTRFEWDGSPLWSSNAEIIYSFGNHIETPGNYWGTYGDSKKKLRRTNLYGTLQRKDEKSIFSLSPYFTKESEPNFSDNTAAGFINFESNVSEYGFQLQHEYSFGPIKALGGLDFGVYDYHSERFESVGVSAAPYKPDNRHTNGALFGQIGYSYHCLDVNASLRYDRFWYHIKANSALKAPESNNSYNTINPSLGIQYRFWENLKLHASFGTAFSVPDAYKTSGSYEVSVYFLDYLWKQSYLGNPHLKPEKSQTADVGLRFHTPNRALNTDLTYFQTLHENKIVNAALDDGTMTFVNADHSFMNGLEWSADCDFGRLLGKKFSLSLYSNWTVLFNAKYAQTALSSSGKDSTHYQDMIYIRKLNGNFGLLFRNSKGFSTRLNARYNGSRLEKDYFSELRPGILKTDYYTNGGYSLADEILKHPDFLIVDFTANQCFKKRLSIGICLSNLLDENYTEKDGYNMQGRQIKANVGYTF